MGNTALIGMPRKYKNMKEVYQMSIKKYQLICIYHEDACEWGSLQLFFVEL